ncbi:MAG: hypothetical protein SGBAC_007602 [Bacillariaceae sp.]
MMQEESVKAADSVVSGAEGEKLKGSETQTETSTVGGSLSNEGGNGSETSIADRLDQTKELMKDFGKTVAIEKPKQIFADLQGMTANLKEKVAFTNKPSEGESGQAGGKADPMEKPKQFFSGMKEKASAFKGFSLNHPSAASNATSDAEELDVASDDPAAVEVPKNDALDRSKQFFTDVKEKAANFKIKMPLAKEEQFDEYGRPIPGPLDRMKSDMKGFAEGIREKMATTNSRAAGDNGEDGTADDSAIFTITEVQEDDDDKLAASNRSLASSEFSKFSDFVQSAKSSANDSLNSMPSLSSFYSSNSSSRTFSDKFANFRHTTISPISEKLGIKTKHPEFEEVEFFNNGTIVDLPEPTVVKELSPEYKTKETSSEEHWENVSPTTIKDTMPSMVHRHSSIADISASTPPPAAPDTTAVIPSAEN